MSWHRHPPSSDLRASARATEQWRINRYVVAFANFLFFFGVTFVMPFLPLYVQQLGITDMAEAAIWSGIVLSAAPLCSGITSPFWANLALRYGMKLMFERSLLAFTLVFVGFSLVTDVYQLLGLRAMWGIIGGFSALSTIMVTADGPREEMSRGLGVLQAAQFVSYAFGPVLGGFLADNVGLRQAFYAPAALCVVALVAAHFLYREPATLQGARKRREPGGASLRRLLSTPQFLPVAAVLFIAQFVDKSFAVTIPLFVSAIEGTATGVAGLAGGILSGGAIAAAISAWLVGRAATNRSPHGLLMFSLIAGAIVSLPMALANSTWQLLTLRSLLGLLAGGTITLGYTVGGLALPPSARASALGLLTSAAIFGSAASSIVSGALIAVSIHAAFALNAVCYVLALIALTIAARRVARRSGGESAEPTPT